MPIRQFSRLTWVSRDHLSLTTILTVKCKSFCHRFPGFFLMPAASFTEAPPNLNTFIIRKIWANL